MCIRDRFMPALSAAIVPPNLISTSSNYARRWCIRQVLPRYIPESIVSTHRFCVRTQETKVRTQETEVRTQETKVRTQETKVRTQKLGSGPKKLRSGLKN